MQVSLNPLGLKLFLAVVSVFLFPISASSQPITPASDGTGTRVNTEGNRHDIEGGSLSQDGRNLFHSFEKFGLSEGEIANFLSNPDIRNILGRVVGGDASIIHGLIQVTGGNSNLFLMNPAGIVFGSSASLNVPADFTATTATGIQFNENWFNAVGNNDYQALVGTPSGYAFAVSQPGVILNEGNLILEPGSHLTLLAGTVINTGQLSSPGGQITLASVEGENLVRISQEGQLLNLEISPMETASGEYPITPLSLPQLLTGGETTTEANTVIVSDNGQIILQNSNTVIPDETGTVIVSGNLDVSDTEQGGNINIFSRNLLIIESEINTNGENISGNLLINSDNDITINQLLAETEAVEITAEQDINFNQMTTEGSLTATTTRGNINRIDDNSLITAPTALFKTGETGSIGRIENPLLLDVENIEAVAGSGGIFLKTNSPLTVGNVSEEFTGFSTTGGGEINLNVEGDLTILENISTAVYDTNAGNITLSSNNGEINTTGLLDSSSSTGNGGNVSLTAEGNITTNNISSYSLGTGTGGNITLSSNNGEINTTGLLDSSSSTGNGGNVSLTAESNITTNNISSYSGTTGTGGNITLSSNNGEINTTGGWLDSFSSTEDTGNVSLTAERNIITGDITSGGGEISLESSNGDIDTKKGRLDSFSSKENTENISSSSRNAGNVSLTAEGNITTGNISSFSEAGRGGNITLESVRGEINTTGGSATQSQVSPGGSFEEIKDTFASDIANLDSYSTSGSGGNITLEAQGNITTYDISSWGGQNSGNVNITTRQGNINTAVIFSVQGIDTEVVSSVSETSRGGQIRLDSPQGNITTSHLLSSATQQGGEITINSGGRFSLGTATINSFASEGEAGNVTINANDGVTLGGDANRNSIRSDGLRRGGNIEITSSAGEINIPGELNSFSSEGEAGNVTIDANNSVTLGNNDTSVYAIRSYGSQQGGNIEITSSVGEINIGGKLDSYSEQGRAGNVTLNAAGQIEIQGIYSDGLQQGGNISITNEGENNINILSPLQTFSEEGIAGEITLSSSGNINTQSMNSEGLQQGGNISITSSAGEINTIGQLNSFSLEGTAGNVTLNAAGHIEIQGIRSEGLQHGGDISITSDSQNSINILGNLDTFSQRGEAGKITLDSPGNITTQNVRSYGQTESGDLIITSQGSISTGSVTTEATGGSSGNIIINGQEVVAGNVSSIGTLSAGKIQIEATDGSIRTLDLTSRSTEGNAGGIDLDATEDINTEDQIVYSKKGNAEIDINAGNDINIKGDQRATTEEGSPSIRNNAENRINIDGEQMATTRNGNALIRNVARNGINVGEQTAIGTERATIENITTGGSITTGPQNAIENGQPGTIINQEGDSNPTNLEPIQPTFDNPEINRPATLAEDSNLPRPTPDPPENPQFNSENPGLINNENVDNRNNTLVQRASEELRTEISNSPEGNNSDEKQSSDISYSSSEVLNVLNSNSVSPLAIASADMVTNLEYNRNQEFSRYFGDDFANTNLSTENVRTVLDDIAQQTGIHSAVIYVTVQTNQLELVVFTAEGKPKFHRIEVPREEVLKVARNFYNEVASPIRSRRYLKPAQQLYDWLIRPLESQLQAEGIDTILLSLDSGLRGLPLAALHDGQQFLIEKYSLSLIPSISLMDTRYTSLKNSKVLGMGASEFLELDSLPSVPVELETVTQRLWQGQQFLNQEFTRENLINQRKKYPYQIIHLATHSDFTVGNPADSYIQLWEDDQLKLDELRTLGWQNPPVELLVLSSCRTGVGDEQAEIGFAGLAIKAGVKSALASLWYVNDVGTLALITEFYAHLDNVVIKADALRQAQLMMIQGQVKIQDSQWQGSEPDTSIVLPPQLNSIGNFDFSHPYYWSGFTMIGSPW